MGGRVCIVILKRRFCVAVVSALSITAASACGLQPGEDETGGEGGEFYADEAERLELIVSWAPGGGTDTMTRLTAPYLSEHIDGKPEVVITYEEGAGGMAGHNAFAQLENADGTRAIMSAASSMVPYLIGVPQAKFDFRDWQPVMAFPSGNIVAVSPETGIEEPADLLDPAQELRLGAIGQVSGDVVGLLSMDLLGVDYKTITGYAGAGESDIAFQRGEINVIRSGTTAYLTNIKPMVDDRKATPLFTTGFVENGELVRDPAFPDVPTVAEVYESIHGEAPSGELWDLYMAVIGPLAQMEKVIWFHGDDPEAAVTEVREGAVRVAEDEEFQKDLEKVLPYDPIVGDDLTQLEEDVLERVNEQVQSDFRDYLTEEHGFEF